MKLFFSRVFLIISFIFGATFAPAYAAAPDGAGPWADQVINFSQGLTKGGAAIDANRSDSSQALGPAENTVAVGTFVSLGFGGSLTLKFDNGISNGVFVVESTNPSYPVEHAKVELSSDGSTWYNAGTLDQSGTVTQPQALSCAQYVRVTDQSNATDFSEDSADGYDVDGVEAMEGQTCSVATPTPSPTPEITATPSPTPTIGCDGDCVTPTPTPVDVCRNIQGDQTTLPDGYGYNSDGMCVQICNGDNQESCLTPTPTETPVPTNPPSNNGGGGPGDGLSDGRSDGKSSCPDCTKPNNGNVLGASTGQVLGASTDTLAATGSSYLMIRSILAATFTLMVLLLANVYVRKHIA